MSAFVLNRNYELQLPTSFVDIDREEMEYVEAGMTLQKTSYGYAGTFNKSECCDLSNLMWIGSGIFAVAAAITGFYSLGVGLLVCGIVGVVLAMGAGYLGLGANHNGMNFKIVGKTFVPGGIRW